MTWNTIFLSNIRKNIFKNINIQKIMYIIELSIIYMEFQHQHLSTRTLVKMYLTPCT